MSILKGVVGTAIVDRQPTGVGERFAEGTKVHCFTAVANPAGTKRRIRHVWFQGTERKAAVGLNIKAARWRTWSVIPVYGRGKWRVDIVDESGQVLKSIPFVVE